MNKVDFPLLVAHPDVVYLDNAATTQKPSFVIDGVTDFLTNENANIHRGLYALSEASEAHYHQSKELVAELLHVETKEIIYTANATAGINLIAQALVHSEILRTGDVVLLSTAEHHANILPWMTLSKHFGFEVRFFDIKEDFSIDIEDFIEKYTADVKVVACTQVSNVSGAIFDLISLSRLLRSDTFFLVDASQSTPHMNIDFQELGCDALVFTGHKMMAYTGIGVLALKYEWIKHLEPLTLGGGTIRDVSVNGYELQRNTDKFEAGTPNIIGAVSLGYALKYIKTLTPDQTLTAGISAIHNHETKLIDYALERFKKLKEKVILVGPNDQKRASVFSFYLPHHPNFNQIGEFFAEKNICIRCGGHCAYPFHKALHIGGTCRMSTYLYNDIDDLQIFFNRLEEV